MVSVSNLSWEQQLILATLQVGPVREARIREILAHEMDWRVVRETAAAWSVFRLFVTRLKTIDVSDCIPPEILTSMSRVSMGAAARNMILVHEFLKIWKVMKEAGIKAAVFKGPVLGIQAFGDSLVRSFSDIDLVVAQNQVEETIDLLTGFEFRCTFEFTENAKRHWARCGRDFGFQKGGLNLDFHQRFVEGPKFLGLSEDEWAQLPTISLESEQVYVFSTELSILALCIHGMRHTWSPAKFLIDLAHFVDNQKDIDWDVLNLRAKKMGCHRIVTIGLHLAESVCGLQLSQTAKMAFPLNKKSRKSLRHYQTRSVAINPKITALILFFGVLNALDSFPVRLRYLSYFILTPSPQDFMLVTLPKSLHWLYYLIRPFRLAWRFAVKPLQRRLMGKNTVEW